MLRTTTYFFLLWLVIGLACSPAEQKVYTFRIGHVANEDHTWHQSFLYLKKILHERTNGRIKVEVYPAEQLGKEIEVIRSIQAGIVEMTVTAGTLQNWTEMAGFCETPFLLKDSTHLHRVADGPIGKRIEADILEHTAMRPLAYFERGARHLTSNRPIRHPDELKGIILRTPNVPSYITAWEALGAKPTPMAFSEVFTSLQQGTIEAQENPFAMIRSASFAEVQDYLNLTGHLISWVYIVVGEKQFQALPDDLQQEFSQAAKDMQAYEHSMFLRNEEMIKAELKEKGMEFIEVDKQAFSGGSSKALYERLSPEMQKIYKEIEALSP
ncbi:MAG: TRAP transporter substrate-binding protein [Bacteroidia bacterium]|nr:TRAP transporter substrate-binding protein [Bacteroidia bacterium]